MTAEDKKKVLAVLDGLMEGTSGAVRATIMACKCAVDEMEVEEKWIPFSDPPREKGCYFVTVKHWFDGNPVAREAYWNGADWLSCEKKQEITPRVTSWMPLPEPPKEGADG